jgi:hypothetical protein
MGTPEVAAGDGPPLPPTSPLSVGQNRFILYQISRCTNSQLSSLK